MPHWKQFQDPSVWLGPQDFDKDKTVQISRVEKDKSDDGKRIMVMYFSHNGNEIPRKLQVPKSVRYALSQHFRSDDTDDWIGKDVTLFAAKCMAFGDVEPCVRVRVPDAIHEKVRKWLKKRKCNPKAYMLPESQ